MENNIQIHTLGSLELNTVHLMDCLEGMKKLPDNSIDVIFTSPPYADRRKNTYGGTSEEHYIEWFTPIAEEMYRILKPTGSFFLNIKPHCDKGERTLYVFDLVLHLKRVTGFRFVDEFSWTKLGVPGKFKGRFKNAFEPVYHFTKTKDFTHNPYAVATPIKEESLKRAHRKASGESKNGSGFAGLRETSNLKNATLALPSNHLHLPQKSNQYTVQSKHSAVFPLELPEFFIKGFSNEGDIILDPFMGSGTTAVASKLHKRRWLGFEIIDSHIDIINERVLKV